MKKLLLVAATMLLAGCDASTKDVSSDFAIPKELKDKGCVMYKMKSDTTHTIYALHCPGATTSTTLQGKHQKRAIVIDEGQPYDEYR